MLTDSPLMIASYAGDSFMTWNLGPVSLAYVPKGKTAKETADLLDMDCLLEGFGGSLWSSRAGEVDARGPFRLLRLCSGCARLKESRA